MRVAMDINDRDILHLRELARIEGPILVRAGRIERCCVYTMWERCTWRTRKESELDSVFRKLVGYGLVLPSKHHSYRSRFSEPQCPVEEAASVSQSDGAEVDYGQLAVPPLS
jgi:hypothetical protein